VRLEPVQIQIQMQRERERETDTHRDRETEIQREKSITTHALSCIAIGFGIWHDWRVSWGPVISQHLMLCESSLRVHIM